MSLNKFHGWINCWKPAGVSSHQVVHQVRKSLSGNKKRLKVGHAGTLDPFAEGVLPLAVGEATKTVSYQMDTSKEYEFTIVWGEKRDTADRDGMIIEASEIRPEMHEVQQACAEFIGGYEQTPPIYSAIKIDGKRACDRVRKGEAVDLKDRTRFVRITSLELCEHSHVSSTLRVQCGKGTYVRVLAEDLAAKLGALAYVQTLTRVRVGKFVKSDAILLGKLEELRHKVLQTPAWVSLRESLDDIPALKLKPTDAERLCHGGEVELADLPDSQTFLGLLNDDLPIGILERVQTGVRPKRMFNIRADN